MVAPHELKRAEFTRGIRGYNTQEVDTQIEYLLQSYTDLYRHAAEMEKAYTDLYRRYKEATAERETVKNDLIDVRLASDKIIEEAQEKADMIIRASKTNCDYIINDFRRAVAEEREKLLKIQAKIQVFKSKMMEECREFMDSIDDLTEIEDTTLYYSTDDELTSRAVDEIKTDVRYAMVDKKERDTISDDEVRVDLDCFTEDVSESDADAPPPDATRTDIFGTNGRPDLSETIHIPDSVAAGTDGQ